MIKPIDTFFYGLFMDGQVLKDAGVTPRSARKASAGGFALSIGKRATLVRTRGSIAWGMVYALTPDERNPDYAEKLKAALTRLGMPADYVAGVE